MQVSWVLTEQERDRRYNKLKKVGFRNDFGRASNKTSSPTATPTSSIAMSMSQVKCIVALPTIPNVHFTVEERLHLEGIRTQLSNISKARFEKFFSYDLACLNHVAKVSYFGGTMDYDHWKRLIDASDKFAQEMFLNLPFMSEFHPNDQVHTFCSKKFKGVLKVSFY